MSNFSCTGQENKEVNAPASAVTAFKVLYTAKSSKKRNNKSWAGVANVLTNQTKPISPGADRVTSISCHADGFLSCTNSGGTWALELLSEDGKNVTKKHVKVPVATEDALQVRPDVTHVASTGTLASRHDLAH